MERGPCNCDVHVVHRKGLRIHYAWIEVDAIAIDKVVRQNRLQGLSMACVRTHASSSPLGMTQTTRGGRGGGGGRHTRRRRSTSRAPPPTSARGRTGCSSSTSCSTAARRARDIGRRGMHARIALPRKCHSANQHRRRARRLPGALAMTRPNCLASPLRCNAHTHTHTHRVVTVSSSSCALRLGGRCLDRVGRHDDTVTTQ